MTWMEDRLQEAREKVRRERAAANGKGQSRGGAYSHPEETAPPAQEEARRTIYTLPELLATPLPETAWTVPGLLAEGMTILAGKPKLGKSMFALNLAITVAAGGMALGGVPTPAGDVLYLSLEDRFRRIKFRALRMLQKLGVEASPRLTIAIEWDRQGSGGLQQIEAWMDKVSSPRLVVIDVWQKFRPSFLPGSQYEQDYNHASALKSAGDKRSCSILPVHHCKKAKADDAVDEISGTLGLAGAADGLLILTRSRSDLDAELFVSGRDAQERKLALRFDPESFVWNSLGEAGEQTESKLKADIIALFQANVNCILSTSEIADRFGLKDQKRESLRVLLMRMFTDGTIGKVGPGRWRYPIQEPDYGDLPVTLR